MGFLDKFFKKQSSNPQNQDVTSDTSVDQSMNSSIQERDQSIFDMDDAEKERIITMIVEEGYLLDNGEFIKSDMLLLDAARLIVLKQQASISLVQRTFSISYLRSGRIIDQLEEFGIIGPFLGETARKVLFKSPSDLENYLKKHPKLKSKTERFYENHKELIEIRRAEYLKNQQIEYDRNEKESIKQKMLEKEHKRRLHKEALNELIEAGEINNHFTNKEGKRELIPQDVMDKVWNRDGGKCANCGSQENLEFDHIIPFSKGGATSYRNVQLLCKKCNIDKSNKIG
jgi:hypothetical protein